MEVVASLSQGRTAAAEWGLFTYKSVPVIFEQPCTKSFTLLRNTVGKKGDSEELNILRTVLRVTVCFPTGTA